MEQQEIQTLRALMEYEAARTEPPESFPHLPDIPAGRYTDPRFFELEQAEIFKKSWLFAAHLDEIPEPGCYMKWEQAGEPVVLVHTEQGEVKAFYNVCSHRGAPVVTEPRGKRLRLTCKYHGWSYSLDGELKAIKDPEDFRDLDFSCRSLAGVRCETFGKFIFVNFDDDCEPFASDIEVLDEEFRDFPLDQRWKAAHVEKVMPCNWKLALEAFIESYHIGVTHPQTAAYVADANTQYDIFPGSRHVNRMITLEGIPSPNLRDVPAEETIRKMQRDVPFHGGAPIVPQEGDRVRELLAARRASRLATHCPALLSERCRQHAASAQPSRARYRGREPRGDEGATRRATHRAPRREPREGGAGGEGESGEGSRRGGGGGGGRRRRRHERRGSGGGGTTETRRAHAESARAPDRPGRGCRAFRRLGRETPTGGSAKRV